MAVPFVAYDIIILAIASEPPVSIPDTVSIPDILS